jgi:RsmE family RNA methyltransferase
MNIILLEADEVRDGVVLLTDHRAEHIQKVLRAAVGDRVRVGIINGMKGHGLITAMEGQRRSLCVSLAVELTMAAAPSPEIDLILALPRPIMLKRILSQIAALGVGSLYLIHANRVEKSFWESGLLEEEQYREHLLHGLEQAVDTRLPRIEIFRKFRPFVEDFLPVIGKDHRFKLLAHPYTESNLAQSLSGADGRILLAVGPEGGWVDFEVEKFVDQGFNPCSIGERILKVDTAVVALHAQITAIRELHKINTDLA